MAKVMPLSPLTVDMTLGPGSRGRQAEAARRVASTPAWSSNHLERRQELLTGTFSL